MTEERISELKDTSIETLKPKKKTKRTKTGGKKNTENPRTVRQLRKVQHTCNGTTRKRRKKGTKIYIYI